MADIGIPGHMVGLNPSQHRSVERLAVVRSSLTSNKSERFWLVKCKVNSRLTSSRLKANIFKVNIVMKIKITAGAIFRICIFGRVSIITCESQGGNIGEIQWFRGTSRSVDHPSSRITPFRTRFEYRIWPNFDYPDHIWYNFFFHQTISWFLVLL